jgi:hypothetical protein
MVRAIRNIKFTDTEMACLSGGLQVYSAMDITKTLKEAVHIYDNEYSIINKYIRTKFV